MNSFQFSWEIPSEFFGWRGNCEGDPLSPPVGEAAQGGKPPLTPMSGRICLKRCRRRIHSMLHGASPDEAVSARGPIAIRYRSPLLVF
jgi:hypothetical protein